MPARMISLGGLSTALLSSLIHLALCTTLPLSPLDTNSSIRVFPSNLTSSHSDETHYTSFNENIKSVYTEIRTKARWKDAGIGTIKVYPKPALTVDPTDFTDITLMMGFPGAGSLLIMANEYWGNWDPHIYKFPKFQCPWRLFNPFTDLVYTFEEAFERVYLAGYTAPVLLVVIQGIVQPYPDPYSKVGQPYYAFHFSKGRDTMVVGVGGMDGMVIKDLVLY